MKGLTQYKSFALNIQLLVHHTEKIYAKEKKRQVR